MLAIIEVASSGLGPDSYPIAVAWRLLRSAVEQHVLIRPIDAWRSWQRDAEKVHLVTRQRLIEEGDAPKDVDRVLNKPPKLRELRAALTELVTNSDLTRLARELPPAGAPAPRLSKAGG